MAKNKDQGQVIEVARLVHDSLRIGVVGTTPLILHRMSQKALHELLLPSGRKSAADKAGSLKHNPIEEYRAAAYTLRPGNPTLLAHLSTAFKGALMTAALDTPSFKKSEIGRRLFVAGEYVGIYGIPKLHMSVVRSADMNRTPDIRTRLIVPTWAAIFDIDYVSPLLTATAVVNLVSAAGITAGVGDWRSEKGKGNYGMFRLAEPDDPELAELMETGGRAAQEAAMAEPTCYDDETAELLSWFDEEVQRRGRLRVA